MGCTASVSSRSPHGNKVMPNDGISRRNSARSDASSTAEGAGKFSLSAGPYIGLCSSKSDKSAISPRPRSMLLRVKGFGGGGEDKDKRAADEASAKAPESPPLGKDSLLAAPTSRKSSLEGSQLSAHASVNGADAEADADAAKGRLEPAEAAERGIPLPGSAESPKRGAAAPGPPLELLQTPATAGNGPPASSYPRPDHESTDERECVRAAAAAAASEAPPPSTPPANPLSVTQLGITLRGLRKLYDSLRERFGSHRLWAMSTEELVRMWVMEITGSRQCRLLEVSDLVDANDVAPPTYFVSHAWQNRAGLLFESVLGHYLLAGSLADEPQAAAAEVAVWIDILVVNQHDGTEGRRLDLAAVEDVVRACSGGTIAVTDLAAGVNPAARAWVLYEWATTLTVHGPEALHVQLDPYERSSIIGALDVRQASCKSVADKATIHSAIAASYGSVEAFNTRLRLQLLLQPLSYREDLRRPPPPAAAATLRPQWDLSPIRSWLEGGEGESRVLCLLGGPGEGKTSLCATLCDRETGLLRGSGGVCGGAGGGGNVVSAHHFVRFNDRRRQEPQGIVKSLTYQLAESLPLLSNYVLQLDAAEVAQLPGDGDEGTAFQELLLKPLCALSGGGAGVMGAGQVIILIDGLDEADPPTPAGQPPPPPLLLPLSPRRLPSPLHGTDATAALLLSPSARGSSRAALLPPTSSSPAAAAAAPPPPLPVCGNKVVQLLAKQLRTLPSFVRFVVSTDPGAMGGHVRAALDRAFADCGGVSYMTPQQLRCRQQAADAAAGPGGSGGVLLYHTVMKECLGGVSAAAAAVTTAVAAAKPPPTAKPVLPPLSSATVSDLHAAYSQLFSAGMSRIGKSEQDAVRGLLEVLLAAQEPLPLSLVESMGLAPALHLVPGYGILIAGPLRGPGGGGGCDDGVTAATSSPLSYSPPSSASQLPDSPRSAASLCRTPSPYALKYLVRHLVAGGDLDSLDKVLQQYGFLAAVLSRGLGQALLRDLLGLPGPTPLACDMLRWLPDQQSVLVGTLTGEDVLGNVLQHCPVGSTAFQAAQAHILAAAAAAGRPGWRLQHGLGLPRTWPALRGVLEGHSRVVMAVAWSPDGRTLASGSGDATVRLWDAASGECIATLQGHASDVQAVAWSPSGGALASGSNDGSVRLWDMATGDCVATLMLSQPGEEVRCVSWSHDGRTLASGSNLGEVRVWDAASGDCVLVLEGHVDAVLSVAWSPRGGLLASGGEDETVRLWHPASGQCTATMLGHAGSVRKVSWSPDGRTLASGSDDATIRLWEAASGECVSTMEGHSWPVTCVSWSPDGRDLVSGSTDQTIRIWDAGTGVCLGGLEEFSYSVAWSPDGRTLASGGSIDPCVRLWDVAATIGAAEEGAGSGGGGQQGHSDIVNSVSWSPDGRTLASGSDDRTIRLWDASTGECTATLEGPLDRVFAVSWSPDGRTLASGSRDMGVRLWNAKSGGCTNVLKGHLDTVYSVTWSPDGTALASGSGDKTIRLWSTTSGQCTATLEGHLDTVWAVAWSPDGKALASGSIDASVRIWDPAAARCTIKMDGHSSEVRSVSWSPDGRTLASGSIDMTIRLWDTATGNCTGVLRGHCGCVFSVTFSPDGTTLASGGRDKNVRLWDVAAGGELVTVLQGHPDDVNSVSWSPDGRTLASGSDDETIRVYVREG
ncbi:hypothetical protein VOLCADRAFT_100103 [Volvox carteri f. nagariensis]|uniref:Uncharacterized protein n=1 Tax=Volvox carteri f. nagariensis TaxID=3068 RepID=D8UJF5_VOLCA|nr:uncharacterized protein VOLCADRAFT_100103 [Volvox carteri f. nagariensis]EFJ40133.1 hypothetical protein VOLCADRAFT_100103 [Volvox carteri f. nagariensis]|eukprot:XP_002958790.1 hypothetical protein VOLCADRAFT_100103 [Volvox carteri f. nagariensis]